MPVIGTPRSFHNKFAYSVHVDGFESACFHKVSEMSVEAKKIEYWPGCSLIPDKTPGLLEYKDITLERGVANGDVDYTEWFGQVADAAAGAGLPDAAYKRNITLIQRDRDGAPLRKWNIVNAWPMEYVAGEWDASSNEKVIEKLKLCFDYFEEVPV